jgi:hypothetical protein
MGDEAYEKEYLARKKRLREMHKKLKQSRELQEIYHKIMGISEGSDSNDEELI